MSALSAPPQDLTAGLKSLQAEYHEKSAEYMELMAVPPQGRSAEQETKIGSLGTDLMGLTDKIEKEAANIDLAAKSFGRMSQLVGVGAGAPRQLISDPSGYAAMVGRVAKGSDGASLGFGPGSNWSPNGPRNVKAVLEDDDLLDYSPGSPYYGQPLIDKVSTRFSEKEQNALFGTKNYNETFWSAFRRAAHAGDGYYHAIKDIEVGLDEQGGYFAPAEFLARVIQRLAYPTSLINRVQVQDIGRKALTFPRFQYNQDDVYTTGIRATAVGEKPLATAHRVNDNNLLGAELIHTHTWMLSCVVTLEMLEDSAFPIDAILAQKFSEAVALLYEDMILNGRGTGAEPLGILGQIGATPDSSRIPEVILSGAAGALSYDGVVDLHTALPAQYMRGNEIWVGHQKGAYRNLLKLKDGEDRPYMNRGFTDGGLIDSRSREMFGTPFIWSPFMSPSITGAGTPTPGGPAANAFPLLYGDFSGYLFLRRVGMSIQLIREKYYEQGCVAIVARLRFGGAPVEPWRFKVQKSNNA